MKTKKPLLPFGSSNTISRKIIILFTIMIMNLSTYFLPYPISSFYTTSYAVEVADCQVSNYAALQVREISCIKDIVDKYSQALEQKEYQNVVAEWKHEQIDITNELMNNSVQNQKSILKLYNFYADYIEVSFDNNTYYFKTKAESDDFISNINQYMQKSYEIQEKVKKEIGSETKEDELNAAITAVKNEADALRRQRAAAAARNNYTVIDTSGISNSAIVQYAIQFVGNPYVWGGTSLTNGADCSGFTQSVFKHFGVSLPRVAGAQAGVGTPVSFSDLQPGDLVFYSNGGSSIAHVAIYIGGSKIVHAGTRSTGINICTVNIMTKVCARRVL